MKRAIFSFVVYVLFYYFLSWVCKTKDIKEVVIICTCAIIQVLIFFIKE